MYLSDNVTKLNLMKIEERLRKKDIYKRSNSDMSEIA